MELDFIDNVNEFGENMVRLYNFDMAEAILFRDLIQTVVIEKKAKLNLAEVDFIAPRNCHLIMGLFKEDEGIFTLDSQTFYCALTLSGYEEMLRRIEPFCTKETISHRYLYEIDNPTDLLFAPAGTW
ncbi:hypothetical protein DNU06_11795 [Putridiphycobacter roseus]|uniref:Uncharacterized protein n=1 Tax=Putridiphycobacter roseus TaxID=2219161 RepID=A0A2W1NLJ1_9FLAO|nr:hypothetical protein [Putridiphycobacter roseus]PZE16532.1 hypothetical protein DNU06_11795 [Putridiphycobacter roseus]